jgi:hypothetical protein
MVESTGLLKKLQIRAGARLWLVNVPGEIAEALTAGAEVEPVKPGERYDGALVFCGGPEEVAALAPKVIAGPAPDGLLWFCYRKGKTGQTAGLTRDAGWEPVIAAGYRPVRSVSIDADWTALRFRESARVKSENTDRFAPER